MDTPFLKVNTSLSIDEQLADSFTNSIKMQGSGVEEFRKLLAKLEEMHDVSAEIEAELKDLLVHPFIEGYKLMANFHSSTYHLSEIAVSQYLASSNPPLRMNLLRAFQDASFDQENKINLPVSHTYLNYIRYYAFKNRIKKKLLVDLKTDELKAVVGVNYPSFFKTHLLVRGIIKELKTRSYRPMFLQPTETESGYFRLPLAIEDLPLPGTGKNNHFSLFVSNSEVGTGALTFGTGALNVKCYNGLYSLDKLSAYSIDHQSTSHFYNQIFKFIGGFVPSVVSAEEFHHLSTRLDNIKDIRRFHSLEELFYEVLSKAVVEYSLNTYGRWKELLKQAAEVKITDLRKEISAMAKKYNFKRQAGLLYELIMNDPVIEEKNNQLALINGLTRMANQSTIGGQKRLDLQHAAGKILINVRR